MARTRSPGRSEDLPGLSIERGCVFERHFSRRSSAKRCSLLARGTGLRYRDGLAHCTNRHARVCTTGGPASHDDRREGQRGRASELFFCHPAVERATGIIDGRVVIVATAVRLRQLHTGYCLVRRIRMTWRCSIKCPTKGPLSESSRSVSSKRSSEGKEELLQLVDGELVGRVRRGADAVLHCR